MSLIRLSPSQNKAKQVKHEALKGAKTYTAEQLNKMEGAELAVALRSCLRNVVGRYMYHYPETCRFMDDMIGEGFIAITEVVNLKERDGDVLKIAQRRMVQRIDRYLNKNKSLSAPCLNTQRKRIDNGRDPIYFETQDIEDTPTLAEPQDAGDEGLRDILDAFAKIQPEDELDIFLMETSNWGRGYQELADDFGVGVATIHRRKQRLYQKYLELTR